MRRATPDRACATEPARREGSGSARRRPAGAARAAFRARARACAHRLGSASGGAARIGGGPSGDGGGRGVRRRPPNAETQPNVFASCRQANLKGEDRFLFMPLMLARRASPSAGASAGTGDGAYEVALEENADGAWEVKPHIANTARRSPEAAQDIARRLFHVFAIFDGHNGWKCADFLRLNLMKALEAHCKGAPPTDREAVRKAVVYLHRKYCSLGWGGGSTLTLVVIQGWNVLVCNVGDSRGYLDTDIFAPTDAPSTTSSSVQRKEDSPHTTTSPPPSLDTRFTVPLSRYPRTRWRTAATGRAKAAVVE